MSECLNNTNYMRMLEDLAGVDETSSKQVTTGHLITKSY